MQIGRIIRTTGLVCALSVSGALAQAFDSGSDGSFGPINIAPNSGTVRLETPLDGIFNATTINVGTGSELRFTKNVLNTPIYLLATGDIIIDGVINVSAVGRIGGPGGFDGGQVPGGDGEGPGAGLAGCFGGGAYASRPHCLDAPDGSIYGNTVLIPLVGGSGGGACPNGPGSGGGGGGAILLASSTQTIVNGAIRSRGGPPSGSGTVHNGGSGGGIRIVSPTVQGTGIVDVNPPHVCWGGLGRIRVDVIDATSLQLNLQGGVATTGKFMQVFPSPLPKLDIIEVAGQAIPLASQVSVAVMLPFGTDPNQSIIVQATDFAGLVPIDVVVTAELGARAVFPAQIDMSNGNPAQVTVQVVLPVNAVARIHAWTR